MVSPGGARTKSPQKKNRASLYGPCLFGESVSIYVKWYFFNLMLETILSYFNRSAVDWKTWAPGWPGAFLLPEGRYHSFWQSLPTWYNLNVSQLWRPKGAPQYMVFPYFFWNEDFRLQATLIIWYLSGHTVANMEHIRACWNLNDSMCIDGH